MTQELNSWGGPCPLVTAIGLFGDGRELTHPLTASQSSEPFVP